MAFRNPPEVNFRAIRDMGLAAWFGSSLMGLDILTHGVSNALDDPVQRSKVIDAGWRGSRGLTAGAVTAYVVGTGLVRYEGKPFNGAVPRWISEGPDSPVRAALTGAALFASLVARDVRHRGDKLLQQRGRYSSEARDKARNMERMGHLLHAFVPAATGALLFSHLKQDMTQTPATRR